MKKLLLAVMAIMILAVSGCGGGTVEVYVPIEPVIYPPEITSYQFTKDPVTEFIHGSIEFYAPDSDIDTMTVVVIDPSGHEISRVNTLIYRAGVTSGTIPFNIDYVTYPSSAYKYTFSIYLTDFNGNTSNQAVDIFWIP